MFSISADDDDGDRVEPGTLRGAQAALPGHQLKPASGLTHQQRLEHTVHPDRLHQLGERLLPEAAARLPGTGRHIAYGHLADSRTPLFGRLRNGRPRRGLLLCRGSVLDQRIQPASQSNMLCGHESSFWSTCC